MFALFHKDIYGRSVMIRSNGEELLDFIRPGDTIHRLSTSVPNWDTSESIFKECERQQSQKVGIQL